MKNNIRAKFLQKILFISLICFIFFPAKSYAIEASVNHACFQNNEQAYLEVYMHVLSSSLQRDTSQNFGARVLMFIKQADEIVSYENYNFEMPNDSISKIYVDIKRFALKPGSYTLEIELQDLQNETNVFQYKNSVDIQYSTDTLLLSDILLMSNLEKGSVEHPLFKHGFLIEDAAYNYFSSDLDRLFFYAELYHTAALEGERNYYSYSIQSNYAGDDSETIKQGFKKITPQDMQVLMHEIKIDDLPSGNYHLMVGIYNEEKELLSSKTKNFQRSNPLKDLELESNRNADYAFSFVHSLMENELDYSLKALAPRLNQESSEGLYHVIAKGSEKSKRYYLHRFWTNIAPETAQLSYLKYMEVVQAVDKTFFSGFGHGFETDRGRVFLKYGKPNDLVSVENEPSAPPYEIWTYNNISETNQTNVRFLFYNPSLGHNDYKMLHSTCRGELNNPAWEVELYNKAPNERVGNTIDATTVQDNFNRNARRYFEGN